LLLSDYGLDKEESISLINKAKDKTYHDTASSLVKYILKHFGELSDNNQKTNII
jgi:hypothetical protein